MADDKALPTTPVTPDQPNANARRSRRRTVPPGEWWCNPHATEVRRLGLTRSQDVINDEIVQAAPSPDESEQHRVDDQPPPVVPVPVEDDNDDAEDPSALVQDEPPPQPEEQIIQHELSAFRADLTRVTSKQGTNDDAVDISDGATERVQALKRSKRGSKRDHPGEEAQNQALARAPAREPAPYEITPEARVVGDAREALLRAPRKGVTTERQVPDTERVNTNPVVQAHASGVVSEEETGQVAVALPLARGDDVQYRDVCAGVSVGLGLTLNELSSGVLELKRGARSGYRRATHGDEMYYVMRGMVELEVGGSSSTLSTGDMFGVPSMQYYKLENVSRNTCRLVFLASRRD